MVAGANLDLSKAEIARINEIVEEPFFVTLAEKCGTKPTDFANAIIKQAQRMLDADDDKLFQIFIGEASAAISEIAKQLDKDGKNVILAAIKSLAECDSISEEETDVIASISEEETKIIAVIIDMLNA
jgi:hypothetical protein